MPLTPEDVSSKRFTTVRLREGYDMTEVDQFLDEVETELARMSGEATELRAQLQAALGGEPLPDSTPASGSDSGADSTPEATPEPVAAVSPAVVAEPDDTRASEQTPSAAETPALASDEHVVDQPTQTLRVTTTAEASAAATRLLELAGGNADQLVSEARTEAEQIVAQARSTAESVESEARTRAEALDGETEERRSSVFSAIERDKAELDAEIVRLRTFEAEYRSQLKSYFEQQLEALDGRGEAGSLAEPMDRPAPGATPETSPLQAILGSEAHEDRGLDGEHQHDEHHDGHQH